MSNFFIDAEDFTKVKPAHTKISTNVAISNIAIEDKLVFTDGEIITFERKVRDILKAPCLVVVYEKKYIGEGSKSHPREYFWLESRNLAINTMLDKLGEFREDLSINWREREKRKAMSGSSILTILRAQNNAYKQAQ